MAKHHDYFAEYSEADIAAEIKKYLEAQGYECWAEVHRIDLVGRRGAEIIGVEVKKQFTAHLVMQALTAMSFCGVGYIATPLVADAATKWMRDAALEKSGLGCLEVYAWGYATAAHGLLEVKLVKEPARRVHDGLKTVTDLLVPETKNWTEAGKPSCRAVTRFRVTALRVRDYVHDHTGCTVREVLDAVPVHWRKSAAVSSLLTSVDKGIIDGVKLVTRNGAETALIPA